MSNYIKAEGVWYKTTIESIRKHSDSLHAVFEAFTNSLESIKALKEKGNSIENGKITVKFFYTRDLVSTPIFEKVEISDTGIGFDDDGFTRFIALGDDRKGSFNKGTGRVQFLHTFDETEFISIYKDKNSKTGFKKRNFTLSKSKNFLDKNAIIRLDSEVEISANSSSTCLIFKNILSDKDRNFFNEITAQAIKENFILHYMAYFCENRDSLPKIIIEIIVDDKNNTKLEINSEDIPTLDQQKSVDVYYSKINGTKLEKSLNKETLTLKSFKISTENLEKNSLNLVSKHEIANDIGLQMLLPKDEIDGYRYLFLLSGDYIDSKDGHTRGEIHILNESEFRKKMKKPQLLDSEEEILLDDIKENINNAILEMYDEIRNKNEEKERNIKELQEMFLLDKKTLASLKNSIHITDTDDVILKKVYKADAEIIATRDAEIKKKVDFLSNLNPTDDRYNEDLRNQTNEFVKLIPIQNRTALTHYVARRKLVLDLFDRAIKKQLEIQKNGNKKSIDEKLLHNLIFQQSSNNPDESDLWLVNEDFIYFKGTSENKLGDILLDNEKIIKDNLSKEEEEYRLKQEGDANKKRPDVLLFPDEGKCIIIEFKSLDTNISEHLNQINRYASLINNLSKDCYHFTTYYGYLIGENIDIDDIRDNDSDFISAHNLNFIFRPYKRISAKFGRLDGSLYTEIISYSTLLERALMRNKMFIDKIMSQSKQLK